mmetsp:Transcript_719/g.825  ORF Transcript_719/g.825 Transcript_719/m.825 type:complete len:310 (-) Transcript_719:210-1139(-)
MVIKTMFWLLFAFFVVLDSANGIHTSFDAIKRFQSTLMIVKYNYDAHFKEIISHYRLWSLAFVNQAIFLPWNSSQILLLREHIADNRTEIISQIDTEISLPWNSHATGVLAYEVVVFSMISWPNFEGYLYAHDDMAMNVSSLIDMNLGKAWFISFSKLQEFNNGWQGKYDWPWWDTVYGIAALNDVISSHKNIISILKKCVGSEYKWFVGQADFFYIPQSLRNSFISIMSIFGHHKVFLEIGVPTFANCLVSSNLRVDIEQCSFWDHRRGDYASMQKNCGDKYPLFHPVKPSNRLSFQGMKQKMNLSVN